MKQIKILIVDDNQIMRKGIKNIFTHYPDLQIAGECSDGDEVIPFLTNNSMSIDAIIMDIKMERMDGFKATKLVKDQYPNIHVFGHSTFAFNPHGQKMVKLGATNYFLKGLTTIDMLDAIIKTVSKN